MSLLWRNSSHSLFSQQHGKSDKAERDRSLGQVANWRQDTDQQFREVQDKLRPLPDEVWLYHVKWPFFSKPLKIIFSTFVPLSRPEVKIPLVFFLFCLNSPSLLCSHCLSHCIIFHYTECTKRSLKWNPLFGPSCKASVQ